MLVALRPRTSLFRSWPLNFVKRLRQLIDCLLFDECNLLNVLAERRQLLLKLRNSLRYFFFRRAYFLNVLNYALPLLMVADFGQVCLNLL